MPLEDHAGDIVNKARDRAGLSLAAAARAAHLAEDELAAFEEDGQWPAHGDLLRLASALGLDPGKLADILNGWAPAPPPLDRWNGLALLPSARRGFTVNAFLAWDAATREAVLFDTGFDAEAITRELIRRELRLRAIAITHSHADHVAALAALHRQHPEARILAAPGVHAGAHPLPPGETLKIGELRIVARPTPGHAEDGVTYGVTGWPAAAPAVAFVGDALFAGSVGRAETDWPGALGAVRKHILSLPDETLLCPGHGPLTTVGEERAHNPFF
jgi:glyoxylase-like metal-dependent hydrolase (beta-lactamase superfamily II)